MNTQEQCQELLMQDVTRIDFMPREALKVALSFNIPDVTETVVTMSDDTALTDAKLYTNSLLSLNSVGDDTADAEMGTGVSHKVAEQREMAGILRTHTLQVPIELGFQTVREKSKALQQTEFHIVLSTYSGTRYLAYGLPNTSQFTVDDQMGQAAQMSVKAVVMSVSGFIKIIDPE